MPAGGQARALCLSRLLPAFQFNSCCEPEFVASTVRPARLLPQLIGQFADHFFHGAHALFPPLAMLALGFLGLGGLGLRLATLAQAGSCGLTTRLEAQICSVGCAVSPTGSRERIGDRAVRQARDHRARELVGP